MAEITSIREISVNKENIKIEFTYLAQYNRDKIYFDNLDFDTAEGESDDSIELLKQNIFWRKAKRIYSTSYVRF